MQTLPLSRRARSLTFIVVMACAMGFVPAAYASTSYVQGVTSTASGSAASLSVSFPANTAAGDLILVGFDFGSSAAPASVTDSQGNTFTQVGAQLTSPGGTRSVVYYANHINGGADKVTVTLSAASPFIEVYLDEYSGVDPTNPIDAQAGATGTAGPVSSGNGTTTVAGDVIYGYYVTDGACTAGSGFVARSTCDSNLIEDMIAGAPGGYAATGSANSGWTMQMVALKPFVIVTPVITSATTASGVLGSPFTYQIAAANAPTSYGATGLPGGLTVNTGTGLISGTPTSAGTSTVTLSAANSAGTGTATLTLTVTAPAPVVTSATTARGILGNAFAYQIAATNTPTGFGATGLPGGLTVDTGTGLISGTPAAAGTSTVTLSATNSGGTGTATLTLIIGSTGGGSGNPHTIQISNDADDGYFNNQDGSGWHSVPQYGGGADLVGSWDGITPAWVTGYRFKSTGINSGDTIGSAYLQLVSSDGQATSFTCGTEPCTSSSSSYRVYGVAQDDGAPFSGAAGNTPVSVPYTTAYTDYTSTGPGDDQGSCQGNNQGQNTCTHTIDVTNIVREISSRPGWTNTSAMRFVMVATNSGAPNLYSGYEDYSANPAKAATLLVNPPQPTVVSSGAWGTGAQVTYPTSYDLGPFAYQTGSTLLLFLGDYYNFYGVPIAQPSISDSCGNTWNILAGPTNWAGIIYFMRSTVYYVQNPVPCPAGDAITITANHQEPIFLHFLAVAGADPAQLPVVSGIHSPSPGTYTTTAASDPVTLASSGLLVSWIFGDSDAFHAFTPQAGFAKDVNSTPNYLTAVYENVSSPGTYQSQFSISPSPDGWQAVTIGFSAPVLAPPVITGGGTANATVGNAFSYQIAASNGPSSYAAAGLPTGLSVSATTGLISGTPTAPGTFNVTVSATNSAGTGSASLTLTVIVAPPVITSAVTSSGTEGSAFSYQIAASNAPTSYGAAGLPAGLSVDTGTGSISGSPSAAGTFTVTLSAANSAGAGTATLTLTIVAPIPAITGATTANGTVGTALSYQIAATNTPTGFGAAGLPGGLSVNAGTGLISGSPTTAGTSTVTLSASNSYGTGTATLTLTVVAPIPVISSPASANGTVGSAFSYQITASNTPTSFGTSTLPAGLSFNSETGLISGTPSAAGTSVVTLSAINSAGTGTASLTLTFSSASTGSVNSHTIQISNDADDGYFNNQDGSGWHSDPQYGAADLVGSWGGTTTAWVPGFRFPSTGINSGDPIQVAYLQLVSSNGFATSSTCGDEPCTASSSTYRVYGVAQDNGPAFSGAAGNTPVSVPYTTAFTDYTSMGPGDDQGSCQGNNQGQNTCTHMIDVTNIVKEITSRPGWTSTSAMRFVVLNANSAGPDFYAGFEDSSDNPSRAATLIVNPPAPVVVSSGAWGTGSDSTYPTTYPTGPFNYPGASTLLLFLGDNYNFKGLTVAQPTITDSCGNSWSILAGPTNWAGISNAMRSTVYYVQNPAPCPAGDTITVTANNPEPIYLHFLAIAGSETTQPPVASAITNPSTYTSTATSNQVTLPNAGLIVSWILGDSGAPHTFTPQAGFTKDLNSTPNHLTAVYENVSTPGSYQSQFSISPSADGWQVVTIGLPAAVVGP